MRGLLAFSLHSLLFRQGLILAEDLRFIEKKIDLRKESEHIKKMLKHNSLDIYNSILDIMLF